MHKTLILQIVLVFGIILETSSQNMNYDYENWQGKGSIVKSKIKIPNELIKKHRLEIAKGAKVNYLFFKVPYNVNDSIKKGRLQVEIFPSVKEAQLALVEYLDCLTTPYKPPQIKEGVYKKGDVTFKSEKNGIIHLAFTRNNVLIIIHAPKIKAEEIADAIDENIQKAPEWKKDTEKPTVDLLEIDTIR